MAYSKQTWADYPDNTTPLSAARLNYMEEGIRLASMTLNGDSTPVAEQSGTGAVDVPTGAPNTFVITATGPIVFNALPAGMAGMSYTITIEIVMGTASASPVTWPSNVLWAEGIPPVLNQLQGTRHLAHFLWDGTRFLGVLAGQNFA